MTIGVKLGLNTKGFASLRRIRRHRARLRFRQQRIRAPKRRKSAPKDRYGNLVRAISLIITRRHDELFVNRNSDKAGVGNLQSSLR
jgi:hypothetical protein